MYQRLSTHHDNPPGRSHIRHGRGNKEYKLIRLAFPNKLPSNLSQFLDYEQAGDALKDDEERA
jgi:hypothetical protein